MCLVLFTLGAAFAQETNFPNGPQYLITFGSPLFARPISTPSMSLTGPSPDVGASDATEVLIPGARNRTVLPPQAVDLPPVDFLPIYYGYSPVSLIDLLLSNTSSEAQFLNTLTASSLDTGVLQNTTAQSLRERGYGVTLPEAVAHQKERPHPARRVYTNDDIDKLR